MEFTKDQITSFQKLYKEELGLEITRTEAFEKALALMRYSGLSLSPNDPSSSNPIPTEFAD